MKIFELLSNVEEAKLQQMEYLAERVESHLKPGNLQALRRAVSSKMGLLNAELVIGRDLLHGEGTYIRFTLTTDAQSAKEEGELLMKSAEEKFPEFGLGDPTLDIIEHRPVGKGEVAVSAVYEVNV